MATFGTAVTLQDFKSRLDPKGNIAQLIEMLKKTNGILEDMRWTECNEKTKHTTTIRSGLPSVTWRLLNYGVMPSKSATVKVTDSTGMLEAYAEVDKKLADLNGNSAAWRLSEESAYIQAMNEEVASTLFYGNTEATPERFTGLAPRYCNTTGANAKNILNAGGSGSDNTSIWLCVWGDNTLHGLYPAGSQAGLLVEDKGNVTLEDARGGKYEGYRSHYSWDCGLTLRDWRYVVRICNIDVSLLNKNMTTGADLVDLMTQAVELPPSLDMGNAVFYANSTITGMLRRQIVNKSNVHLSLEEVAGKRVLTFDGIPVRKCEALVNAEETVS